MADDRSLVEVQLVSDAAAVPAPDMLLVGGIASSYTDILHVVSAGELKRGTVLMSMPGSDEFTLCTEAGLSAAQVYAILAESVTIGENEYADVACYIAGEFNSELVIFPWEDETMDHDEVAESARGALRRSSILLRKVVK